ncbi:uncharacterized protein LOC135848587 [Planococcus citri]|uniref:uncharacterized protein LOC135848587 n=1 Tax=Planococcus citri TaxID=170843 RepID=UPI0031F811A0
MELLYQNHFAYQFVSDDDMPTKNLHRTTFFRFNYFPIPKHKSILRSMIRADNYIRLYSKETKKPLTIYSGRSQKTILRKPYHCAPEFICKPVPFEIDFFWRIIKDEQNNAIILVTQLTQVLCNEKTYICHKNRDVLQSYWWHGGCIYTCSVDKDIIELLQLPQGQLKNTGTLDVSFAKKIETETTESPQSSPKSSNAKSPAKVTMQDFMSKKTFMLALLAYDASLAETVVDHNPPQSSGFFDILSGSGGHGGGGAWFDGGGGGDVGGHAGGDDGGGAGASD